MGRFRDLVARKLPVTKVRIGSEIGRMAARVSLNGANRQKPVAGIQTWLLSAEIRALRYSPERASNG